MIGLLWWEKEAVGKFGFASRITTGGGWKNKLHNDERFENDMQKPRKYR